MGEREKPFSTDSISGVILNAANRSRQKDIELEEAAAAAKRLEEEAQVRAEQAERAAKEALERSYVDPLTDCLNRNYFIKFLKENFDPNRDDGNVGLVFVDVNELKTTNDTLGHAAGDKVLQSMAKLLKSGVRKSVSTVVHLHGDEFVIISEQCATDAENSVDDERGMSFEESLETMMQRLTEESSSSGVPYGFSYGIAIYDKVIDEKPPETLVPSVGIQSLGDISSKLTHTLMRADNNMYQHKARNSES